MVLERRVQNKIFKNMPDLQFIISWSYQRSKCPKLKQVLSLLFMPKIRAGIKSNGPFDIYVKFLTFLALYV